MLEALDRLVEQQGIVEAGERLGVNYRTVAKSRDSTHVSRRMREAQQKSLGNMGSVENRKCKESGTG